MMFQIGGGVIEYTPFQSTFVRNIVFYKVDTRSVCVPIYKYVCTSYQLFYVPVCVTTFGGVCSNTQMRSSLSGITHGL